jgi:aminoglycoside phosphotransferase (APT) family kinase protein
MNMSGALDATELAELAAALREMQLLGDSESFTAARFGGGVSCDAWLVTKEGGAKLVVKRALPKLRVTAEWRAPAQRSRAEAAWFRLVAGIDPALVPRVLGEAPQRHMLAMEFFPPDRYPLWKAQLAAGETDSGFAASVGTALARIHAATARNAAVGAQFANAQQFFALRLDPYLLYTAEQHADVAPRIRKMADNIAKARTALMHADVSPKNILHGPAGPVFLDAETACYGDPAFDLAFCLNHLLLKCVWHPQFTAGYLECFKALATAYLRGVVWEISNNIERRVAALLPMLLLARIDGKSPVEYMTTDIDKGFVRGFALRRLQEDVGMLDDLAIAWYRALQLK